MSTCSIAMDTWSESFRTQRFVGPIHLPWTKGGLSTSQRPRYIFRKRSGHCIRYSLLTPKNWDLTLALSNNQLN